MLRDLNEAAPSELADALYDVCICGAGAAGITLALNLPSSLQILLIEGGGLEASEESQAIYKGETLGEPYYPLDAARLRFFGGTSNHWDGWCHPLDAVDFEKKDYVAFSGWPIRRADLEPYLPASEAILDLAPERGEGQNPPDEDLGDLIARTENLKRVGYQWSTPTLFATKYRAELGARRNIHCYVNANLVDIALHSDLSVVSDVTLKNYANRAFRAHARVYVLAAGGIENPRILLNCRRQIPQGIGNQRDLVGRFFAEHPNKLVGSFLLDDSARRHLAKYWTKRAHKNARYFSPTREFMWRNRVLNFGVFVEPYPEPSPRQSDFRQTLKDLVCGEEFARDLFGRIRGRDLDCQRVDGRIRVVSEQAPNPDSRVKLIEEKDRFGWNRVAVNWQFQDVDKRTIKLAALTLGEAMIDANVGRVKIDNWLLQDEITVPGPPNHIAGRHHMCTTRMSDSDRTGVVDRNLKVFGVCNLYVAGSSVFATGGHDSPTISIVQLSLRLARRLTAVLQTQRAVSM